MTVNSSIFSYTNPVSQPSHINSADGSQLHINHIGSVFTSNLSLPATFHVPKLSINIIYVGQLCDLKLNVIFSSSGYQVQNPQT